MTILNLAGFAAALAASRADLAGAAPPAPGAFFAAEAAWCWGAAPPAAAASLLAEAEAMGPVVTIETPMVRA